MIRLPRRLCPPRGRGIAPKPATCAPATRLPAAKATPAASRRLYGILAVVGLLVVCVIGGIIWLASRTQGVTASVARAEWMRSVAIEAIAPVKREGWWDEIPSGAQQGSCELKYRYSQDQPAANSREVCGTPYTVDTGTGIGEVVQECVYEVSDDWCSYTVMDWNTVEITSLGGGDMQPAWPSRALASDERYGDRQESYTVVFDAGTKTYTITPGSEAEFRRYAVGSEWVLNVNTFGSVVGVEPAN